MLHTIKRHVLVYATGFVLLGGGTAYATHEAIYSSDIVDGQVKSVDIADNGVTGVDVNEATLDLGCRPGVIHGFARVKGSADIETYWRTDPGVIDTVFNCRAGTVSVRRESTGVYYVRFDGGNPARIAVANANTDGASIDSPAVDNIVSVSKVEPGVFRVETVDVNDDHSGDTDPQDTWFTLMLL
jgi:hypothetical protein